MLPDPGDSRWSVVTLVLSALIAVVLCGGMAVDALGMVSIYATPGQLVLQSKSGRAPVGSDGKTQYYAVDHRGSVLLDENGAPATNNSVDGAVVGVWKGGAAKSNHMEGEVSVVDDDPNTFKSPFRYASVTIDRSKMVFSNAAQFEWGSGAFDGGVRVFKWASTAGANIVGDDAAVASEDGDVSGLRWRRAGSGRTEDVEAEQAEKNAANRELRYENGIVFTGQLDANVKKTFGSPEAQGDDYVVRVRYPDAALLRGGRVSADLVFTYRSISLESDKPFNSSVAADDAGPGNGRTAMLGLIRRMGLIVESRYGQIDEEAPISTDGDNWVWYIGSEQDEVGEDGTSSGSKNKPMLLSVGVRGVCELSVVKSGGSPDNPSDRIKGTVVFSMFDIDAVTDRPLAGSGAAAGEGWNPGLVPPTYSESVSVLSGAKSFALVPDGNLLEFAGDGENGLAEGLRFCSTIADSNTYDSGFSVLADTEGFVFDWVCCGGRGLAGMNCRVG